MHIIHIFWTGKGFLVLVFGFGFSLLANLITNSVTGGPTYWDNHKWPLAASLLVSAVACWFVGLSLRNKGARTLVDLETGEHVIVNRSHTFFFIPVMWWGPSSLSAP